MKYYPILMTGIAFLARIVPTAILIAALLLPFNSAKAGWFTVGPDYKQPTNAIPSTYKSAEYSNWEIGHALDNVPKGNWWEVFGDTNLNALETQALQANQ